MTALGSRLSKLEAAAGVSLSPEEQFNRLVDSQSDATLLQVLAWLRAQIAGTELPEVSEDIAALVQRLVNLIASPG